ncbi:MAG: C4-dicarboxylate ABC transporter substrate-binding protein [Alphaproteobacteria bacterium]|nr:MAG: C4-dicarboxylate ABC transporter substrate-binding protein [Alphaproteobacteria bacterium]
MSRISIIAGALAACGLALSANAQVNLTAETASPVSVPGNTMLSLAEVASKEGIANIQVATGPTLTNSVQNVAEGKTDIASAPFLLTFLLARGAGPYAKIGKEKGPELAGKLAVLYTYRFGSYGLFAYDSRNFGGWDAVKGATIYNGPPRGAALNRARALIKLATGLDDGKGYTGLQVNWGQAIKTITDGSADAQVLPLNFPDGRISAALASGTITVWSMPKDKFESEAAQKYMHAPGTVGVVMPKDGLFGPGVTVVSEDDKFRAIGEVGGEVVNVSMDFELAKALTRAFIEHMDVFKARTPFMPTVYLGETDLKFTGMCGAVPVKYHPGAVAAWEEAGYTIPDCAKP